MEKKIKKLTECLEHEEIQLNDSKKKKKLSDCHQ